MRRLAIAAAAALVAALALAAVPAQAAKKHPTVRAAERAVKRVAQRDEFRVTAVTCRREGRRGARALRFRCRWRTERAATRHRVRTCRGGRARVRKRGRRYSARAGGSSCGFRRIRSLPFFGYSDSYAVQTLGADYSADLARKGGSDVLRLVLDWRETQPSPGVWRWDLYDRVYNALRARGARPLWIIGFAPRWAWPPGTSCTGSSCLFPPGSAHDGAWREFARRVSQRYPEAAGIEVWNEPNLSVFWRPYPDAARFTRLLKLAHAAIKEARPSMPVIAGGFNNIQTTGNSGIALETYLRSVYSHGAKGNMDAIGFHPYPVTLDDALLDRSFAQARRVRGEFRDDSPLWVTEIGLTTTGAGTAVTEQQQADGLVRLYRKIRSMNDVEAFLVHSLVEENRLLGEIAGYGVLRARNQQPKLAYCMLALEVTGRWPCS
jgi:hypothetical protein